MTSTFEHHDLTARSCNAKSASVTDFSRAICATLGLVGPQYVCAIWWILGGDATCCRCRKKVWGLALKKTKLEVRLLVPSKYTVPTCSTFLKTFPIPSFLFVFCRKWSTFSTASWRRSRKPRESSPRNLAAQYPNIDWCYRLRDSKSE